MIAANALRLRRFAILLLLTGLLPSAVLAQSLTGIPSCAPENVGLSAARLERVSSMVQGYVDRNEASGAVALIARRGKVAYLESWGNRDREGGSEMTEDTIFRIYSMSKPITSVAVMMLYEEGHFFLNDPVSKYLPELAEMQVQTETVNMRTGETTIEDPQKATRPITIRDLLRHTAGFSYGVFGDTQVDKKYRDAGILTDEKDLSEMVTELGQIPLRFDPGTQWHYSVSVDVAGRLVEVVSGQSFDEFLRQRLFSPLRMHDTGFRVPKDKMDRFAVLYTPKGMHVDREAFLRPAPDTKEIEPLVTTELSQYDDSTRFLSGGGGLVSTARDYLRFCQMMLNGGELIGTRILSRKSVELMTTGHLQNVKGFGGGTTFGLGFSVVTDVGATGTLSSEGTFAWGGAAGTKFWIDPKEELIGVFMVQIIPHRTTMGEEFQVLTYQAIDD